MIAPGLPSGRALLINRLRERLGSAHVEADDGPHILCRPGSTAEVAEALSAAAVGGVRVSCQGASAALLHLSLSRLCALSIDETSLLCTAGAGLSLLSLERALRERGLSLGPLPPPSMARTLGAALSAPRPTEASPLLGRLRDRPVRIEAVLPERGEALLPVALAPRRAAGPDLKQLVIGGRGTTGVITAATLPVVRPGPAVHFAGWLLPIARAAQVLCELVRRTGGAGPADVQLVNPALLAPLSESPRPGAVALLLRVEGSDPIVEAQRALAESLVGDARPLPDALCRGWLDGESGQPEDETPRWPSASRALSPLSPLELAAAYQGTAGPRLLCGVHLHGAALCAEPAALPPVPTDSPSRNLFSQLRLQLDQAQLLC